ncbi:MAG: YtxH domain-containing protein [Bacteroidales bacterium]|jgi:gas vesicle protein|nr:YtxH domain-containing protein [Bacteroidales bacterium]
MKATSIFAFLGGAALGAATALLLAPDSGLKTRKKLKKRLKDYGIDLNKEELTNLIHNLKTKAKPEKETVEKKA